MENEVGYTMADIRYQWNDGLNSVQISNDVSLPQFKVLGHRQKTIEASLSTGNYSRLACEIQFVRSMGYYLIQIYIPSRYDFLSIFLINCTQEINSSTWYIVCNWKTCFQFNRGDIVGKFLVESWSYSCKSRLRSDNCVDNDDVDGIYKRCSSKNLLRQIDRCVSWILLFYGVCFPFR